MDFSTLNNNLYLLATHSQDQLALDSDGKTLRERTEGVAQIQQDQLRHVIYQTNNSYKAIGRPLWVNCKIVDPEGNRLGIALVQDGRGQVCRQLLSGGAHQQAAAAERLQDDESGRHASDFREHADRVRTGDGQLSFRPAGLSL